MSYEDDNNMNDDEYNKLNTTTSSRSKRSLDNKKIEQKLNLKEKYKRINNVKRLYHSHYQLLKPTIQSEIYNRLYNNNKINQKFLNN